MAFFFVFAAACLAIHLYFARGFARAYLNWFTLQDPFGVQLWRKHWPHMLLTLGYCAVCLLLTVAIVEAH